MPFGVYVHIPFCAARCGYCDFATWTDRSHLVDAYVDACITDVTRRVARDEITDATSVFFGGGTPSMLPAAQLLRVLDAIPRATGAEVTVECNPDSVDDAKLAAYRAGGVTRVSFGVQSLRPHVLTFLDRTHDPGNVERAVHSARAAGFETFNLDLIYGAPGESTDDWRATLDGVLDLGPPHVSAYALTVEPGTPLGRRVAAGTSPAPDDDDQAAKYDLADDVLASAGLRWYELSNWSRPGHECRHNLDTWRGADYAGIGCAAHSHRQGHRWWNVRTPDRYLAIVADGGDPTAGDERLDDTAREGERLALGLRTRAGAVPPAGAATAVDDLVAAGLLERAGGGGFADRRRRSPKRSVRATNGAGGRVVLTRTGRRLAGDVTARLLAASDQPGTAVGTR